MSQIKELMPNLSLKCCLHFPLFTSGKTNGDPDCEPPVPVPTPSFPENISQETKARVEEEAYNKG